MNPPDKLNPETVSLSPVLGSVVPAWLADSPVAQSVMREAASRGVGVYVKVPARMTVIEKYELLESCRSDRYELSRPYYVLDLKSRGEVIDEAVIRKDIQFLQLTHEAVRDFAESLGGTQHWFQAGALRIGERDELVQSRPWSTLRCLRPCELVQKSFFRPRHAMDGIRPAPLVYSADHELQLRIDSLFVDARDVDALTAVVSGSIENDDPHNLSHDMPALLHLYRAAKKFASPLSALHRGNAPKDKERLSEAKLSVGLFLQHYGPPFDTAKARDAAFRVIDPKHVWARGAASTSFERPYLSIGGIDQQFQGEPDVTKPLRILIMMAREVLRAEGQKSGHWWSNTADTTERLEQMGFKGAQQQEVLAKILREGVVANAVPRR